MVSRPDTNLAKVIYYLEDLKINLSKGPKTQPLHWKSPFCVGKIGSNTSP